ncbi:hypothetical protein [Aestuariivivens sediminis]|uniref:hypothetical protein n=1 Tax=Aestuariivivens sediminis TaxID=2913557 RepID=UPI001F57DEAF|nr:hypothetical protein [Aestuariivivens sediminis]
MKPIEDFTYGNTISKDLGYLVWYATLYDYNKTTRIFKKIVSKEIKIVAVYPILNETPPKNGKYIGSIIDGELYSVKIEKI